MLLNTKLLGEKKSMEEKEKFMDTLRELSDDEKVLKDWIVEDNQRWREQGERRFAIKEGLEQGIEQEKELIVINMLKKKIDYDTISDVTGKTVEEIKEIEKNLTDN